MKLTEKENLLLRRALDKATTPAEAQTAARAFVDSLRARGISGYDFFVPPERSGPPPRQPGASTPPPPRPAPPPPRPTSPPPPRSTYEPRYQTTVPKKEQHHWVGALVTTIIFCAFSGGMMKSCQTVPTAVATTPTPTPTPTPVPTATPDMRRRAYVLDGRGFIGRLRPYWVADDDELHRLRPEGTFCYWDIFYVKSIQRYAIYVAPSKQTFAHWEYLSDIEELWPSQKSITPEQIQNQPN